jgi:hypothetical protein
MWELWFAFVTELLDNHLSHKNQILHECVDVHKIAYGKKYMNQCGMEASQNCPKVWRSGVSNVIFTLIMRHISHVINYGLILICHLHLIILSTNNKHKSYNHKFQILIQDKNQSTTQIRWLEKYNLLMSYLWKLLVIMLVCKLWRCGYGIL